VTARLTSKPVLDDGAPIGAAATRGEVAELLTLLGRSAEAARLVVQMRCVEGPDAFHLVTVRDLETMLAEIRAIHAGLAVAS
jgi:hypothetical protein